MLYAAFYLHWITLLCLAAVCCDAPEDYLPITLNAVFSSVPSASVAPDEHTVISAMTEPPAELSVPEPVHEPPEPAEKTSVTEVPDKAETVSSDDLPAPVESEELPVNRERQGDRRRTSMASQSAVRMHQDLPPHAVTQGSFAVWTDPAYPKAGEPYRIIVQVRLPEKVRRYSTSDLEGLVIGTDGYRKQIPGTVRAYLPILNGQVRLEVPIVSADRNVNDTIMIRSRMLREAQRLTLRF